MNKCAYCLGKGLINLGDYIPVSKRLGLQRYCEYCAGWGNTIEPWIAFFLPKKFSNRKYIESKLDFTLKDLNNNYLGIVGYSSSSDSILIDYLYNRNIKFLVYELEYHIYKKNSFSVRNKKALHSATDLIVFNNNDYGINTLLKYTRVNKPNVNIKIINCKGVKDENSDKIIKTR